MVLSIRLSCVSSTDAGCRGLRQSPTRPTPSDLAMAPVAVSWVSTSGIRLKITGAKNDWQSLGVGKRMGSFVLCEQRLIWLPNENVLLGSSLVLVAVSILTMYRGIQPRCLVIDCDE